MKWNKRFVVHDRLIFSGWKKIVIEWYLEKYPQSIMINHVLLKAKRCIYLCLNQKNKLIIDCFKRMLFTLYKDEQYIANQKGKLSCHHRNWNVYNNFLFLISFNFHCNYCWPGDLFIILHQQMFQAIDLYISYIIYASILCTRFNVSFHGKCHVNWKLLIKHLWNIFKTNLDPLLLWEVTPFTQALDYLGPLTLL